MNKTTEYIYREGGMEDKTQLQELVILSYGVYESVLSEEGWSKLKQGIHSSENLENIIRQSTCFVCVDNNKIIGMAFLVGSGHPWDVFQADWSYIRWVGVNPGCQGKGIARKLTELCIEQAKKNKEKVVALHTSEFMDAARHLYESLGFKKMKEIEPRFGKRYWLYMLDLSS